MSICRFWWYYGDPKCDVYVYGGPGGWLVETWNHTHNGTPLPIKYDFGSWRFATTDECADFLEEVKRNGIGVPQDAIDKLKGWDCCA